MSGTKLATLFLRMTRRLVRQFRLLRRRMTGVQAIGATSLGRQVIRPRRTRSVLTHNIINYNNRHRGQRHQRPLTRLARHNVFQTRVITPLKSAIHFVGNWWRQVPIHRVLGGIVRRRTFQNSVGRAGLPNTTTYRRFGLLFTNLHQIGTHHHRTINLRLVRLVFRRQGRQ